MHSTLNAKSPSPKKRHHTRALVRVVMVLITALSMLFVATGCEKDAKTLTNDGNVAMIKQKYPEAINNFDAALKKDPANFRAMIGLAETYLKQKDLSKSREHFDKAKTLAKDKADLQYLNQKLQELTLAEAEGLKDKDPEAYEKKLREVITVKDRGQAADQAYFALGDLYMKRADEMAKDKKTREKAVEYYEQMKTIRTQPALRKKALAAAKKLQRAIFADQFAAEYNKISGELTKEGRIDEANKRIKVIALMEDKELNPKTDEEKEVLRKKLSRSATLDMIKLTYTLSGTPVPESVPNKFNFKTAKVEEELMEKGKVQLTVSVTLEELENLAYSQIILPARAQKKEDARDARKEAAADKKDGATPAPKDGAAPADPAKKEDGAAPADPAKKEDGATPAPKDGAAPADPAKKEDGAAPADPAKKEGAAPAPKVAPKGAPKAPAGTPTSAPK